MIVRECGKTVLCADERLRGGGWLVLMKMTDRSVMEFVPTDLKFPFRTVERICSEIVKAFHGLDVRNGAVYLRPEPYCFRTYSLFPLFVETSFI